MRRKIKVVGTIDDNTRVFGTTNGVFARLLNASFEKQFDQIKEHDERPKAVVGFAGSRRKKALKLFKEDGRRSLADSDVKIYQSNHGTTIGIRAMRWVIGTTGEGLITSNVEVSRPAIQYGLPSGYVVAPPLDDTLPGSSLTFGEVNVVT